MSFQHRKRRSSYEDTIRKPLVPLVRWLSSMRVRPDTLTAAGWVLALCSGVLFGMGYIRSAGVVMLMAGLFDALDGAVARELDQISDFGAFLDSTLDRFSESAVFVGIVFYYAMESRPLVTLLAGVAMTFSLLTSYTRARAESLGYECEIGLLERAGRVVLIALSSIAGFPSVGLGAVAAGALVTTVQRILHVRRETQK